MRSALHPKQLKTGYYTLHAEKSLIEVITVLLIVKH